MFNPYQILTPFRAAPLASAAAGVARTGINWAGLLSNTQKTLNIVNQAIPLVYQVKPIFNNAKTMFRVVSALGKSNNSTETSNSQTNIQTNTTTNYTSEDNGPSFFI